MSRAAPKSIVIFVPLVATLAASFGLATAAEITRLPLVDRQAVVPIPPDGKLYFLSMGQHDFAPTQVTDDRQQSLDVERERPIPLALFQDLHVRQWTFAAPYRGQVVQLSKQGQRDPFWDQLLVVQKELMNHAPRRTLIEVGKFGSALSAPLRKMSLPMESIRQLQGELRDPVVAPSVNHEIPWQTLASAALPLDFQKVLLAVPHDANPAFAYQNGQWFTTWTGSPDLAHLKEDRWFAPALAVGNKLVRPAPLSATTEFQRNTRGEIVPEWILTWTYGETTVRQRLFSFRPEGSNTAALFVRFEIENPPADCRLAIGTGRRLNAHYWDDKTRERTPIPFFELKPRWQAADKAVVDSLGRAVLISDRPFELEDSGPFEQLVLFDLEPDTPIDLFTPQGGTRDEPANPRPYDFTACEAQFQAYWSEYLAQGAQAQLPSREWMDRIASWKSQVQSITRVHYQGRERLSYGAYFYQYYFGIEEAWPVIALAQWNLPDEAQRQAEIMLEAENLDKANVHHQSRNGAAPWAAAVVARLTDDSQWLGRQTPAMIECARWTETVRRKNSEERTPLTRGLLPPHIYGGDIRDPATSLYATAICWKGMFETADALKVMGSGDLAATGRELAEEARDLRDTVLRTMKQAAQPVDKGLFIPLALELPSLNGQHEGPYSVLTSSRLGNYWNLFAPSLLQLQLGGSSPTAFPNAPILDYMAMHGGLWGSLPRFYDGLDAAYAGGIIEHLLHASAVDQKYRARALAALEAYFLHAASRNGYAIPEVAGLFPDRFNCAVYEQVVREAPWSFGMYDDDRYLEGHISFTEPLGAGAGQALSLVRNALIVETRDGEGKLDGRLVLLPTIPTEWLAQGKSVELDDFPTEYGRISLRVDSDIEASGEVVVSYAFHKHRHTHGESLPSIRLRLSAPGKAVKDHELPVAESGTLRVKL